MTDKVSGAPLEAVASPSLLKKHSHPLDPLDPAEVLHRQFGSGGNDR